MRGSYLQHGRRHGPAGSDPITDFLAFNTDNEGGWLYVVANDSTDIGFGTLGVLLAETTGDGFQIVSILGAGPPFSSITLLPESIALSADAAGATPLSILISGGVIDVGGARIVNGADGIDPTDFATVEQITAGSGTVTDVTSTDSSITVTSPTTTPDLAVSVVDGGSA